MAAAFKGSLFWKIKSRIDESAREGEGRETKEMKEGARNSLKLGRQKRGWQHRRERELA